jgi:hypothetical protein
MRIQRIFRLTSANCLLVMLLAVGASAAGATPDLPNGGMISGQVSSPGGYPLESGTLVRLFEAGTETVRGIANPETATGTFQFGPVRNGLYVIKAVPPESSPFTQSLPKTVSVVNAPVNVGQLALTKPQISGSVLSPDGTTHIDAEILVYLGDGRVFQHVAAPSGDYQIGGLPVGSYALQAFPNGELPYWRSVVTPVNIQAAGSQQEIDLTLRQAQLWGYARDDQNNPIREAKVLAANENHEIASDLSNASGFWAIGGLADGTYRLTALPPWPQSGLLTPEPVRVSIPGATNPYTLVFASPPKVVSGNVITNTGWPVFHAQILARRVSLPGQAQALSQADGSFQLKLAPGLWALTVQPVGDTAPADWVYMLPPQFVLFRRDNLPEVRTQDFSVTLADATVSGVVTLQEGGTPPFTVTVALHNDEGVGRRALIDPVDGSFELKVPNGRYKVAIHPQDPGYIGPIVEPVALAPEGTLDLGSLSLLRRDAVISGTISSSGAGVSGIPLAAWRAGAPGALKTASGPDGLYALAVAEGQWHVQPAPGPDQPYIYAGDGQQVDILAGGTAPEVNFELLETEATILGILVNPAGEPVEDASGWAVASQVGNPVIHNGAPIENGVFTIHVPSGSYHLVVELAAGGEYSSTGQRQVTVVSGGQTTVTLTVLKKNSHITGALWNPRTQDVVEDVAGVVGAWSQVNWAAAPIDPGNGVFDLDVAAGLWRLNYRIDPQAGYTKISGPLNIAAQAGKTAYVPLPVLPKDGKIEGVVLDPDGNPLAGATVVAKGANALIDDLWLKTQSQDDGSFSLDAPAGRFRLGANSSNPDWLKPFERMVEVPLQGISSGNTLQFRSSDVAVSGALTVTNTVEGGMVKVWAWSPDGSFTQGDFPVAANGSFASGSYELGILSDMTWNLGAVFETSTQYWFGRAQVITASGANPIIQDLLLRGPFPKPAPVVVTFDASEPQQISLADGTQIFIPAGAMPTTGLVTLRIVPVAALPQQQHVNIYKYGYAFLASDENGAPIEEHFNQEVIISFSYQKSELLQLRIHERRLKPAYFSTTEQRWIFPENFVIDFETNRITMQIDHFTDYVLTGPPTTDLYLPIISR